MEIRVFDKDGNEKDYPWAQREYGISVVRAATHAQCFRVVELREKYDITCKVIVLAEDGSHIPGIPVAFWWPDAPESVRYWYGKSAGLQSTNKDGDTGFGYGEGSVILVPAEGGPHAVWLEHPDILSDMADKLGMFRKQGYRHLNVVFQLMPAEAGPEPEGVTYSIVGEFTITKK